MRITLVILVYMSGSICYSQSWNDSLTSRISRYFYVGRYDSVVRDYEINGVYENDPERLALLLQKVAKSYYNLGQNQTAIKTYQRLLHKPPQDSAVLAEIYCNYSEVLIETAQYDLASAMLSGAEELLAGLNRPDLEALKYNVQGVLYLRTTRYAQAMRCLNVASRMAQRADDQRMKLITLNNFGILYFETGNYQDALDVFKEALGIDLKINKTKDLAVDYINIANVYCELNDKPGSVAFFQKAKQAYEDLKDSSGISLVLGNLSTLYISLQKYHKAEESLTEAIHIARMTGDQLGEAEWMFSLALVSYQRGNYAEAFKALETVAQQFIQLESYSNCGRALVFMGKCKTKLGEYNDAKTVLTRAAENYGSKGLHGELWNAQSCLAEVYGLMKQDRKADSLYLEAIEGVENSRETLDTELTTYFIENDRLEVYRSYVLFLIKKKKYADAFFIMEKAKARNLTDILRAGDSIAGTPATVADTGSIIEYFLHNDGSYAFVKSARTLKVIPIGDKVFIDKLVVEFLTQIKQKNKTREVFLKLSAKLYHELWEPVDKYLESIGSVTLVPDECLYYLPFESLFDGHRYIAEKYEITYAPSALIAHSLQTWPRASVDRIAVFYKSQFTGNRHRSARLEDLPYVELESERIKTLFGDRAEIVSGINLKKPSFPDSVLTHSTIVHFAAHGVNNPERPELSAIDLFSTDSVDGLLTAGEIQKMNLNGKLVVLSACETSAGSLLKGEGMLGLTRSFMIAGASSIVASMWNVYDESTAEFMKIFYSQKEVKRLSISRALQETKISMIKDQKWSDPAFWAPFVLWGRGH